MGRLQVTPLTSNSTIPKSELGTNIWGFFKSIGSRDYVEKSWHKTYEEAVEAAQDYLQIRFNSEDELEENYLDGYHASVIWGCGQGIESVTVMEIPPFKLKKPALVYILKQRGLPVKGSVKDLRKILEKEIEKEDKKKKEEKENKKKKHDEHKNEGDDKSLKRKEFDKDTSEEPPKKKQFIKEREENSEI